MASSAAFTLPSGDVVLAFAGVFRSAAPLLLSNNSVFFRQGV
jgi:hypothetical protein